jgi:hypothetical protein
MCVYTRARLLRASQSYNCTATIGTAVIIQQRLKLFVLTSKLHKEVRQVAALYRGTSERRVSKRENHSNLK